MFQFTYYWDFLLGFKLMFPHPVMDINGSHIIHSWFYPGCQPGYLQCQVPWAERQTCMFTATWPQAFTKGRTGESRQVGKEEPGYNQGNKSSSPT